MQRTWPLERALRGDFVSANLTAADLRRLDLSGLDFAFAIFHRAKLTAADLSNANIHDADFRGALGLTDDQRADLKKRGAIVD